MMRRIESLLVHAVLIAAVVFAVYPLLWLITLAFAGTPDLTSAQALPIPRDLSLHNYRLLFSGGEPNGSSLFFGQLLNSLLVSAATALLSVAVATPAAYALARMRFPGKEPGVRTLMATQMFPAVAAALPLYLLLEVLHLLDTRTGLVLVYATTSVPFAIFQLRGAIEGIPIELEEAAWVDGATRFQGFVKVILPAARPAIAVTALFAFMSAWNEFVLAATILSKKSAFTLPVVLQGYVGEHSAAWGVFAAGALFVSVPVMVLFYFLQRELVSGITAGGVKG